MPGSRLLTAREPTRAAVHGCLTQCFSPRTTALRFGVVLRAQVGRFSSHRLDGGRVSSAEPTRLEQTTVLSELRSLPTGLVLDGELVAWKGSEPYFPLICRRVLNRDMSVPMTFIVFDLLRLDGRRQRASLLGAPPAPR